MNRCAILHVDDDDADAFLFRLALDEAAVLASVYRVLSSEHAIQFLRKLSPYERAARPRLIVTDITLPRRDGWWLQAEIQRDPDLREIPVVMISSQAASANEPQALKAGAYAYIEKPFEFDSFVTQVRRICATLL